MATTLNVGANIITAGEVKGQRKVAVTEQVLAIHKVGFSNVVDVIRSVKADTSSHLRRPKRRRNSYL